MRHITFSEAGEDGKAESLEIIAMRMIYVEYVLS